MSKAKEAMDQAFDAMRNDYDVNPQAVATLAAGILQADAIRENDEQRKRADELEMALRVMTLRHSALQRTYGYAISLINRHAFPSVCEQTYDSLLADAKITWENVQSNDEAYYKYPFPTTPEQYAALEEPERKHADKMIAEILRFVRTRGL